MTFPQRLGAHLALAGLLVLALLIFGWLTVDNWIMPRLARHGWEQASVPNITGLPAEEAKERLEKAGFIVVEDPERKNSDHLPPDRVVIQRPAAGDSVKLGHTVRFWLSAGATTVDVPDLAALDSAAAENRLKESGLVLDPTLEWIPHGRIPYGNVVRTLPAIGSLLVRGAQVRLVLSSGPSDSTPEPETSVDSSDGKRLF